MPSWCFSSSIATMVATTCWRKSLVHSQLAISSRSTALSYLYWQYYASFLNVQLKKQTSGDGNLGAFTQVLLTMRTQFMAHLSKAPSFPFFLQWLWLPILSHSPCLHTTLHTISNVCNASANRLDQATTPSHPWNLWHIINR